MKRRWTVYLFLCPWVLSFCLLNCFKCSLNELFKIDTIVPFGCFCGHQAFVRARLKCGGSIRHRRWWDFWMLLKCLCSKTSYFVCFYRHVAHQTVTGLCVRLMAETGLILFCIAQASTGQFSFLLQSIACFLFRASGSTRKWRRIAGARTPEIRHQPLDKAAVNEGHLLAWAGRYYQKVKGYAG